MEFRATTIPDVKIVSLIVFDDDRGFFMESFKEDLFSAAGITGPFVQDNHTRSKLGVLRGLHYQIRQPQGKLVRVAAGKIFDVAVDLRRSSATFGRWVGEILSEENKLQIWVPKGFAHGFYVLSEWAEVLYKASDYYSPESERTLLWNDPDLAIEWPLLNGQPPILSGKDASGKRLSEAELFA
ncbi:MAG: dTDP-4-dehydrorhamnose 3,5-epimerase [Anaerolineales bacterium]